MLACSQSSRTVHVATAHVDCDIYDVSGSIYNIYHPIRVFSPYKEGGGVLAWHTAAAVNKKTKREHTVKYLYSRVDSRASTITQPMMIVLYVPCTLVRRNDMNLYSTSNLFLGTI